MEVAQGIGADMVRCIAMGSTDGLVRGMKAIDTGKPIQAPVGHGVLGRMFNVLGQPIDGLGAVKTDTEMSIHRKAPAFDEQATSSAIWNGIKSSTCCVRTPKVEKSACSAAPVSEKPY